MGVHCPQIWFEMSRESGSRRASEATLRGKYSASHGWPLIWFECRQEILEILLIASPYKPMILHTKNISRMGIFYRHSRESLIFSKKVFSILDFVAKGFFMQKQINIM
jgi:hypothetical protein